MTCTFDCKKPVQLADNQTATQLYCIAREAVTNALKHAQARNIRISLEGDDQAVTLRVQDDGIGLPEPPVDSKGMGLKIMRYRAGLINAHLSIGPAEPVRDRRHLHVQQGSSSWPEARSRRVSRAARILIVDDHPAIREALAIRIAGEADLEVCGEAADVAEAFQVAAAVNPDVAVIDLALKSGSGLELIKRLKTTQEKLLMIVWSMYSEDLYAERALRAGARGYITKEQATGKIIEAIRCVLEGKLYLSPAMTREAAEAACWAARRIPVRSPIDALSDRELDVFRLIGQGVKTAEIAARLHLSVKTVETYRDRIRQKLILNDGTELAHYATQWLLENG